MSDKTPEKPKQPDPLAKIRKELDRALRDANLSQNEYNALIEDMKKRRDKIEGSGDNIFDDIIEE